MSNRFLKHYQWALWIALIAVLIPMCAAAFYNRPTVDDLYQPYAAMKAVENGGGLWDVLAVGWKYMLISYFGGGGTFMSMFLSYIPPTVVDYHLAWIHPIFFMLFLTGACFSAGYCVRAADPAIPRRAVHCAALLMSLMLLTLLPSVSEGYYWYSGAVNYTFTFTLSIYLFSALFAMELRRLAGKPLSKARLVLLCPAFFLLGGGNFSTAAAAVSLYTLYLMYLVVRKKLNWTALPYLFLAVGFALSVLAPGNASRQAYHGVTYPIPQTFMRSFHEAFQMVFQDTRPWVYTLFFVPVIVAVLPHLKLEYKYGLLLPVASWAVLAASLVPPMYAYANAGADRQLNAHFFVMCFLMVINLTYLLGWIRKLILGRYAKKAADDAALPSRAPYVWVLAVLVLFMGITLRNLQFRPGIVLNIDLPPVKALSYLRDGSLKTYADDYDHMVALAKAHPDEDVVVDRQPSNLLFGPFVITSDADDWYNRSFADYYGCRSIVYLPEDPADEIHR